MKLTQKNMHRKPAKGHIVFNNGVEVKLPQGLAFGSVFTITGIEKINKKNALFL